MKRLDLLNLTKSATNTMILDAEEKYEKASKNISGIPELLDRFMLALSAVSGVPVSLLFGRSAAGMNATGDNDKTLKNNLIACATIRFYQSLGQSSKYQIMER